MIVEDAKLLCGQLIFIAAFIAACLGGFNACRKSNEEAKPAPAAAAANTSPAQPAAGAAQAKTVRQIPMSTFQSTAGLRVGARIQAATAGGQTFIGTITEIGKDSVTVEVESAK